MTRSREELIAAKRAIGLAKLTEFCRQCERLAHLVAQGVVDRAQAADELHDAAVANGLIRIHGDDFIAGTLAGTFATAPMALPTAVKAA